MVLSKTNNAHAPTNITSQSVHETITHEQIHTETITLPESIKMLEFYHTDTRDNRPFVYVKVKNREIRALMDTGANISVLGRNLVNSIFDWGDALLKSDLTITTADRTPHKVQGIINVNYWFLGKKEMVPTVVVPTDTYHLILGMDFIRAFGIDLVARDQLEQVNSVDTNFKIKPLKVEEMCT